MFKSENEAPIQFRPIAPNPAGGEWPKISSDHASDNIDVMHDELKQVFDRIVVPMSLANAQGNTKQAAEVIATLFLGFLQNFLADNVKDGERKTQQRLMKAVGSVMDYSLTRMKIIMAMQAMGMPQAIISAMLHDLDKEGMEAAEVKVFKVKPGEELPEELRRLLDL